MTESDRPIRSLAAHNRDLILGLMAAGKAGDSQTVIASMHPDVVVHEPAYLPYGGTHHGREGFLTLLPEVAKVIDLETAEAVSVVSDETCTVLVLSCELVSSREQRQIAEHWRIEDGLVREVRVFWSDLPN